MSAPPEDIRLFGHRVVDWIADYLEHVREQPVMSRIRPGDLVRSLPAEGPETGEPMQRILDDFERLIPPALTHWNHPRFLAYFAITASDPGILGEMLTAALNVNGMLWRSSPAVAELEEVTLGWLRKWLGLPEEFFGIIYDTASTSSLHAIAAAREAADPEARWKGNRLPLVLYCSDQAHSSIDKAVVTLGLGLENVRRIPSDACFRMRPEALEESVLNDQKAGRRPFCVVATAGTTSTASVDPVPAIADVASRHGLWLHVDAAYAGPAALAPEFRWVLAGAERADSLVLNPHKWMLTPIDCSAFYVRRPEVLRRAFTLVPDYLRTSDADGAVNLMDYGFQLGRRFRALKLWFVLRRFGRSGLAGIIRGHVALAAELAGWISQDPRFELAAPVSLSVVCFRYRGTDEDNARLLEAVNSSGIAFLSQTKLGGRVVLRMAIGNLQTTREDLRAAWECVRRMAGGIPSAGR